MKINAFVLAVLSITITVCACNSQSRYNLEDAINKNVTEVIGKNEYGEIDREIVTHQPAFEVDFGQYRYGDIALTDNSNYGHVQLIVNSMEEKKIIAVFISINDNASDADKMKNYLDKKFGSPEILKPEPTEKHEGFLFGNSA